MRLRREIRLAKHEADVRVRQEMALLIDDIGLAEAPDSDLRNDIPDEFQIDLGRRDRRLRGCAVRHGDHHVRFRAFAERHGAVPDAAASRLTVLRLAGKIRAGTDDVHRQPGHAQLLTPLPVE